MTKPHLSLVTPAIKKRTVAMPRRPKNKDLRTREHLTEDEVKRLLAAVKKNRHGLRDHTMVLVAFRHGLRASEVVDLRWDQIHFETASLHVRRLKNGTPSVHPLSGEEMRALRKLKRENPTSPFVFLSEREGGTPFTRAGFAAIVKRAGKAAGLDSLRPHAHMLRHSTGYSRANAGKDTRALQAYLGHKNIQHTVRYTEMAADRFKDFWRD
jgi:integrase